MRPLPLSALAALAGLACASLSGCGKPATASADPAVPLASVNGVDIRLAAPSAAPVDKARVDAAIERELLRDAALRNKLDKDPLVQRAIGEASAEILAQAYLQSKAATLPVPTAHDVASYVAAHPDLFEGRTLFRIEQIELDSKDFTPELKEQVDGARSIEQVAAWLDARKVHYSRARLARHSADLAPPLLAKLKTMRPRQLFVVVAGERSTIDVLLDAVPDPMPQADIGRQAALMLRQARRAESDQMEILQLRSLARIDYFKQQQGTTATAAGALPQQAKEQQ